MDTPIFLVIAIICAALFFQLRRQIIFAHQPMIVFNIIVGVIGILSFAMQIAQWMGWI